VASKQRYRIVKLKGPGELIRFRCDVYREVEAGSDYWQELPKTVSPTLSGCKELLMKMLTMEETVEEFTL
jgi:hypothetical protein